MFTVELKVNGALIGHVHGINKGFHLEVDGEALYEYEYYDVEARSLTKGNIFHNRDDGIKCLIKSILDDLESK